MTLVNPPFLIGDTSTQMHCHLNFPGRICTVYAHVYQNLGICDSSRCLEKVPKFPKIFSQMVVGKWGDLSMVERKTHYLKTNPRNPAISGQFVIKNPENLNSGAI